MSDYDTRQPPAGPRPGARLSMRIVSTTVVEDCGASGQTVRYRFDEPVTHEAILRLSELGALDVFMEFRHPCFRVSGRQGLRITGAEGDTTCLVVLPAHATEAARESFERLLRETT